jgi:hypothetical protein
VNKIIVEGKNDKAFIDYLFTLLNDTVENSGIVTSEIYIEPLAHGLSQTDLKKALEETLRKFDEIEKIGIIIDLDNETVPQRIQLINNAIKDVFEQENIISTVNQEFDLTYEEHSISVSCFFMNVKGKGELMNVLREIKNKPSAISDCTVLCLSDVPDADAKELDDEWVYHYIKWDNADKRERRNAKDLKFDILLNKKSKTDIWDFNHPILMDLKTYLSQFKTIKS